MRFLIAEVVAAYAGREGDDTLWAADGEAAMSLLYVYGEEKAGKLVAKKALMILIYTDLSMQKNAPSAIFC